MKKTALFVVWGFFLILGSTDLNAADATVRTLRGDVPITAESPSPPKTTVRGAGRLIPKTFAGQPPLVPHAIAQYTINRQRNDCFNCHGIKGSGAPAPSASHYEDRDGKRLSNVSSRRYFCEQCHVPQKNASALVDNTFKGVR